MKSRKEKWSRREFLEVAGAARLGWIDGIMMTYNFRLMHTDRMARAVDACRQAGIGLTAMKTQGGGQVVTSSEVERRLAGRFVEKGFSREQAKLKAVWENPHIASICSQMPNLKILKANAAAAADRSPMSRDDWQHLEHYAHRTARGYCAGCTDICEAAVDQAVPIGDVMRYMMYARSYGDCERARVLFGGLPDATRAKIAAADYAEAEKRCPRGMAIGRLMRTASRELA